MMYELMVESNILKYYKVITNSYQIQVYQNLKHDTDNCKSANLLNVLNWTVVNIQ